MAIRKTGLSEREFARRAGWSQSYQRKLTDEASTVSEATAKTILMVLAEQAVVPNDVID